MKLVEHKNSDDEPGVITEQFGLMEMYLIHAATSVREAQQRSLFKPCRFNKLEGCVWCRMKRYILRKRYR